jgi:hypothetical protein
MCNAHRSPKVDDRHHHESRRHHHHAQRNPTVAHRPNHSPAGSNEYQQERAPDLREKTFRSVTGIKFRMQSSEERWLSTRIRPSILAVMVCNTLPKREFTR